MSSLAGWLAGGGVGGQLVSLSLTAAQLMFDLGVVYVMSTLLVLPREELLDGVLLMVRPDNRERARAVLDKIWSGLGNYLRAKLVIMVCVGALMSVALQVFGVPFAAPAFRDRRLRRARAQGRHLDRAHSIADHCRVSGTTTVGLTFLAPYIIRGYEGERDPRRVSRGGRSAWIPCSRLSPYCGTTLLGWEGGARRLPFAAMLHWCSRRRLCPGDSPGGTRAMAAARSTTADHGHDRAGGSKRRGRSATATSTGVPAEPTWPRRRP